MDTVYENSAYIQSKADPSRRSSQYKDKSAYERDASFAKRTKILLIVLAVSLGFALGVICGLSLMYAGKFSSCDIQQYNVSTQTDLVQQMSCTSETEMDLLDKYHKVRGCLASCTEFISLSCKPCEDGWTAHGGKCYFFSSEKQTWFKSLNSCETLKAHLVTINTRAVQGFLVSKIKETHWIGLNDLDTEGRWIWLNNQTLEETTVQFWFIKEVGREPDNWDGDNASGEDCACLGYENSFVNSWFDASCEYKKKFICEKKYHWPSLMTIVKETH